MSNEESMTVNGNGGSGVHWGGGSGNGGGASSNGANVAFGGQMSIDLGNGYIATFIGTHPINPIVSGAPWGSDKNAASIISSYKDKPAKFKANIQNWTSDKNKAGSLNSPAVGQAGSNNDVDNFNVIFGTEKYRVTYNRKQDSFTSHLTDGHASKKEHLMDDQAIAVVKLYLLNERESNVLDTASGIITDTGKTLSGKIGDKYQGLARSAANDIKSFKGKKLRSFKDAMAAVNELANNPKMKLSQADKTAVSNALKQMNLAALADRFKGLEKAFTWGDRLLKAEKIRDGISIGITTGNWQKLSFEVEAMYLSGIAGSVALGIVTAFISATAVALSLPSVTVTALTVVAIIGIAILTSYIDAEKAKALNNAVLGLFK